MRVKLIKQHDEKDCGAACLAMIGSYYGYRAPLLRFRQLTKTDCRGTTIDGIVTGAAQVGLESKALKGDYDELEIALKEGEVQTPFIAHLVLEEGMLHFAVVQKITPRGIYIFDPSSGKRIYKKDDFKKRWSGNLISMSPSIEFKKGNEKSIVLEMVMKMIVQQKKMLIKIFLLSLLITGIGIFGTFVFSVITEYVMAPFEGKVNLKLGDMTIKVRIGIVMLSILILYLFGAITQVFRGKILTVFSGKLDMALVEKYYRHILNLPLDFFGTRKVGEILSRHHETANIRAALSEATITFMLDFILLAGGVILLYRISPKLLLVTSVTLIIYGVVLMIFKGEIREANRKIMQNDANTMSYFKEIVEGIESIKVYQLEQKVFLKVKKLLNDMCHSIIKGGFLYTYQDSLVGFINLAGVIVVLWYGVQEVINGKLFFGNLLTYNALAGYFLIPVQNLLNLQTSLQTAIVSAERLGDVLMVQKEELIEGKTVEELKDNIHFQNICYRYGNQELTLNKINLTIGRGEKVAFVGESGSGKSTLARILVKLYVPESGNVLIGEENLTSISIESVRKKIIYVPQNLFFFSDSILNNIIPHERHVESDEWNYICRLCMVDDFVKKFPLQYDTLLDENGNNLSAGQRQRLAIARALLRKPDILILDEATSNLDSITERSIMQALNAYPDMTCIVIAHRLKTIEHCDRIYVMESGEVAESGTHEQLVKRKGKYYAFWNQC